MHRVGDLNTPLVNCRTTMQNSKLSFPQLGNYSLFECIRTTDVVKPSTALIRGSSSVFSAHFPHFCWLKCFPSSAPAL